MTGITQGSGSKPAHVTDQNSSSSAATLAAATSVLGDAVKAIQSKSGNNTFGKGDNEALIKLIMQLIQVIDDKLPPTEPSKPQPKPLQLTRQQDKAVRERFDIKGALSYEVLDSKKDGKLSAGDTLVISGGITGGEISRKKLTQQDVKAINGGSSTSSDAQQQLDANRKKWDSLDIDDYSFTLQRNCFCRGDAIRPINIEVRDGSVKSATYADTGELLPDDRQTNKQSIYNLNADGLFNLVEQGIKGGAAKVDVSYDKQYGLPASIYIDQSFQIADEEMGYTISNFRPEPSFTTLMVGEEDGGLPPVDDPIATTLAIGEEDGGHHDYK
ncbi:hypothetical protein SAMN05660964_01395 [Thiothrix caldifontis]|uniref:Uncharacterized protein n=1 Tax=Thiothrix caldifontis TaxID=525918 RepID=A0A1H4ABL5_9GAMM|nr:DUF6174 domain-containing protein [Thiothrix caldifontis]SEA33297.1 hypothetical protein SAMN05660964_01395 [Thiothrix caldifontis]